MGKSLRMRLVNFEFYPRDRPAYEVVVRLLEEE